MSYDNLKSKKAINHLKSKNSKSFHTLDPKNFSQ